MNTISGHYTTVLPYSSLQSIPNSGLDASQAVAESTEPSVKTDNQKIEPDPTRDSFTQATASISSTQRDDNPKATPFSAEPYSQDYDSEKGVAENIQVQGNSEEAPESAAEKEGGGELTPARPRGADGKPLSEEDVSQIQSLKRRDVTVRRHEDSHLAAAGGYATGGAHFQYTQGPDGRKYAVGGRVNIDTSAENTPEATIRKMRTVKRAALAPAQPSSQDRRVAATAGRKEIDAHRKLTEVRMEKVQERLNTSILQIQNVENSYTATSSATGGRLDTTGIDLLI